MSGVVRGLAESSVPVGSWLWRGNPAGMNCCGDRLHSLECAYFPGQVCAGDGRLRRRFSHTGHGPFRPLIVSNLKWGGPCRGHYVFPAGRYQIFRNSLKRRMEGISYFPYTVALRGRDKVRPRT